MLLITYSLTLLAFAALPALLFLRNLPQFQRAASQENPANSYHFSVLIPARNEEAGIEASLRAILNNDYRDFEVLVMDDQSTDQTAAIVEQIAASDERVRLLRSTELPAEWNGKQYACWQLAQASRFEWLIFLDADVRLSGDALSRVAAELAVTPRDLLSGFPFQETKTLSEKLLIPLMHVVLLGYLPLNRMRASRDPAFGAGCGQLFIARRDAYFAAGGHQTIRSSRHDGLKLPRAFRAAGLITDVFDATDLARCRMYQTPTQVVRGLLKNANEGIAQRSLIIVFSVLLLGGQVMPVMSLGHALFWKWPLIPVVLLSVASVLSYVPRALATVRFNQSWSGLILNPIAVAIFVALQWIAFLRTVAGKKPIAWRGRN